LLGLSRHAIAISGGFCHPEAYLISPGYCIPNVSRRCLPGSDLRWLAVDHDHDDLSKRPASGDGTKLRFDDPMSEKPGDLSLNGTLGRWNDASTRSPLEAPWAPSLACRRHQGTPLFRVMKFSWIFAGNRSVDDWPVARQCIPVIEGKPEIWSRSLWLDSPIVGRGLDQRRFVRQAQ
jgi:hypothetical protein